MPDAVDRTWLLSRLRDSLRVLSAEANEQITWLDGGKAHPDELALDFDNYLTACFDNFKADFGHELTLQFERLNARLDLMSGPANSELWTIRGIASEPAWNEVRTLAAEALLLQGWPRA